MQVNSLAYVNGFKCIGGHCPDSCCIGWDVDIDQAAYKKYKKFQSGPLSTIVKHHLYRNESMYDPNIDYAKVKLKTNKWCPFLNDDKWCLIQKSYGEQALSHVCQSFPRIVNQLNGIWEMSLTLSCPIAAERLFLSENSTASTTLVVEKKPKVTTFVHEDSKQSGIYAQVEKTRNAVLERLMKAETLSELVLDIAVFLNGKMHFKRAPQSFNVADSLQRAQGFYKKLFVDHKLNNTRFHSYLGPLVNASLEKNIALEVDETLLFLIKTYFYNDFYQNLFPYTESDTFEKSYYWFLGRLMMLHFALLEAQQNGKTKKEMVSFISAFSKGIEHHHSFKTEVIQSFQRK